MKCPKCGSEDLTFVYYGDPTVNGSLLRDIQAGRIAFGGNESNINTDALFHCNNCKENVFSPAVLSVGNEEYIDCAEEAVMIGFSIGGYFNGDDIITFEKETSGWTVEVKHVPETNDKYLKRKASDDECNNLLTELFEELRIHEWNEFYEDPSVLDGEGWGLQINSKDGKLVHTYGSNAYPPYWSELIELLKPFFREAGIELVSNGCSERFTYTEGHLKIVEWNIGFNAKPEKIIPKLYDYLVSSSCIIALLEVTQKQYEKIISSMDYPFPHVYSLDYRKPGKYDGKSRQLGILFITSPDITISESGVFNRTLLPERTLFAEFDCQGIPYTAAVLHSITGCEHKKAKSLNFCSFAEEVEEIDADIVLMDANEPDVDHYDIKQMKFFDNKGNGAKILFDTLSNMGLEDSFAIQYDKSNYEEGKPLAVSHVIKGCKKPRRYDFIFINTYYFDSVNVDYLYDEAIELGTDHAIVAADVELS